MIDCHTNKVGEWFKCVPPSLYFFITFSQQKYLWIHKKPCGLGTKSKKTNKKLNLGPNYPNTHLAMNSHLYSEWDVKLKVFIMVVKSD